MPASRSSARSRAQSRPVDPAREDVWLSTEDVATLLGVSVPTVRDWRYMERGPAYVRIEGRIRYRMSAVEGYIEARTVRH